jgi:hypothetical protein
MKPKFTGPYTIVGLDKNSSLAIIKKLITGRTMKAQFTKFQLFFYHPVFAKFTAKKKILKKIISKRRSIIFTMNPKKNDILHITNQNLSSKILKKNRRTPAALKTIKTRSQKVHCPKQKLNSKRRKICLRKMKLVKTTLKTANVQLIFKKNMDTRMIMYMTQNILQKNII